jgi:hypothetical protein
MIPDMEIGWILGGFFIFVTLIYVAVAFFLPEWVGITGKTAHGMMRDQAGDGSGPADLTNKPNDPTAEVKKDSH